MKNLIVVATFLLAYISALSQSEFARETDNYTMGIGPILGYKLGINAADTQEGVKNGVGAASMPDFGAQLYVPLDPENEMGLIIDAIYANYPYMLEYSKVEFNDNINYIGVGANFYLSGFTVGLNVGLPMGGTRSTPDGDFDIESASLNTMFELRIGGNFTLNESNTGRMILFINGGYQINGQYSDEANLGTYNTHPASIQLGLGYILNIGGN